MTSEQGIATADPRLAAIFVLRLAVVAFVVAAAGLGVFGTRASVIQRLAAAASPSVQCAGWVNICPAEIEAELPYCPAVDDVAVFGIPHDEWGKENKGRDTAGGRLHAGSPG